MGTAAWICFECRSAVRRNTQYTGDVPCPNCRRLCAFLGYRIPVPPKRKRRAWAALREQLAQTRIAQAIQAYEMREAERAALRHEIDRIGAMAPNSGRASLIRRLQRRLAELDA